MSYPDDDDDYIRDSIDALDWDYMDYDPNEFTTEDTNPDSLLLENVDNLGVF